MRPRRSAVGVVLLLIAVLAFLMGVGTAAWHWQHVNYYVCVALGLALVTVVALLDGFIP